MYNAYGFKSVFLLDHKTIKPAQKYVKINNNERFLKEDALTLKINENSQIWFFIHFSL